MKEVTVKLSNAEQAMLELLFMENKDKLKERWDVRSLEEFVKLLAMHGANSISELFNQ